MRIVMLLALLFPVVTAARSEVPRFDDILPVSRVRPGMKGYGLTVFQGTRIERFEVTVVGVVRRGSWIAPGHDMILVRLSGGPITSRGAFKIQGMSGSPIYIDGKIIGAFSQAESLTKEPLGGVTPIEDMLEAWDTRLPESPVAARSYSSPTVVHLPRPLQIGSRQITKVVLSAPRTRWLASTSQTAVLRPCATTVISGNLSPLARKKLAEAFEPYNVELVTARGAAGQAADFKGAPLEPGAAFSMMLSVGDFTMGSIGTVTYRKERRILGFGHPFMGIGPLEAPICSAYIHDVYPLISASYKIGTPGPIVGSSLQDRTFSVSGVLGKQPRLIPVEAEVTDRSTGRRKTFRSQVVAHPNLSSALISSAVATGVAEIRGTPGAAFARIATSVQADEVGSIERTNTVFDARSIDSAATADLDEMLSILANNPFYPVAVKSARVKVEIESGRPTAQIERVYVREGRLEPGQSVEVGVVIKPYKQPAVTRTVTVQVPPSAADGTYTLLVRGGAPPASLAFGGLIIRPSAPQDPQQAPPANVRQMIQRLLERERGTEIVVRLWLPTTAVTAEGQRMAGLPAPLDAIMRSTKSSGVRLDRDEVRVIEPTDWVVSGTQTLTINVRKRDNREIGAAAGDPGGPPPQPPSAGGRLEVQADFEASRSLENGRDPADVATAASQRPARPAERPKNTDQKPAKAASEANETLDETASSASARQGTPETPVARLARTWRQVSRTDMSRGTMNGVTVNTQGDLVLTRVLSRLCQTTESFLWCLALDGRGGLVAGTGTQGRLLRFSSDGKVSTIAQLPEVSVHSVLVDPNGVIWAGTGPNGRIYRVEPAGGFKLVQELQEKYVLALARDTDGNLLAAAGGGGGKVYRITADGSMKTLLNTNQEHVMALAVGSDGTIYAGTSGGGDVYRVLRDGRVEVVFDAPEQSVTALAVRSDGRLLVATAPRGVLYVISSDGNARVLFDKASMPFTALTVCQNGEAFAAAGNTVYAIGQNDTVMPLDCKADLTVLSLAAAADGTVYAGTGSSAELLRAAAAANSEGVFESVVHDARTVARWGAIRWNAATPAGTTIALHTRTGNVAEPDTTWTDWAPPSGGPDNARVISPPGRYIQYRIRLASENGTTSPALRELSVSYLPKNQAPRLAFGSPSGGERWSGIQTVRWEATDPDQDTLSFDLQVSRNGTDWLPAPVAQGGTKPAEQPRSEAGRGSATNARPAPRSVQDVKAQLDQHPDLPIELREAILQRTRENNLETARPAEPAGAPGSSGMAQTREPRRSVDTTRLPDGVYRFRVTASDRPSNADDPQTTSVISEPVVICNSPPSLFLFKSATTAGPDGAVRILGAVLQKLVPVTGVQYRLDGGEWLAASANDGIFDSDLEGFSITVAGGSAQRTLEVRAFNAAGLVSTEKMTLSTTKP